MACAPPPPEPEPCAMCECGAEPEFCFIEASIHDRNITTGSDAVSHEVWMQTKPPAHFSKNDPSTSARLVTVTRTRLSGALNPKRPVQQSEKPTTCYRKIVLDDDDDD